MRQLCFLSLYAHRQYCPTGKREILLWPCPRKEGDTKRCFCPSVSVCPYVAYIVNNSRTQRPIMSSFERTVPHVRCDSHTSLKGNGQRSRSPGPLILTHIVIHIFRMARPTNFKHGIRVEDDDLHQPEAPRPRSKVKDQCHKLNHLYVSSLPLLNSGNKMLYLWH